MDRLKNSGLMFAIVLGDMFLIFILVRNLYCIGAEIRGEEFDL